MCLYFVHVPLSTHSHGPTSLLAIQGCWVVVWRRQMDSVRWTQMDATKEQSKTNRKLMEVQSKQNETTIIHSVLSWKGEHLHSDCCKHSQHTHKHTQSFTWGGCAGRWSPASYSDCCLSAPPALSAASSSGRWSESSPPPPPPAASSAASAAPYTYPAGAGGWQERGKKDRGVQGQGETCEERRREEKEIQKKGDSSVNRGTAGDQEWDYISW